MSVLARIKPCSKCGTVLPLEAFHRDSTKSDGRYPSCKLCRVGPQIKVIQWRPCEGCGKWFKPRHNHRVYVRRCSRACIDLSATKNGRWAGDAISYSGAHTRARQHGGSAGAHTCECGEPAVQWAYDHADPNEHRSELGCLYSSDPAHYVPRCVPCHRRLDLAHRRRPFPRRPGHGRGWPHDAQGRFVRHREAHSSQPRTPEVAHA